VCQLSWGGDFVPVNCRTLSQAPKKLHAIHGVDDALEAVPRPGSREFARQGIVAPPPHCPPLFPQAPERTM
jgi:hypothetical protein